MRRVSPDLVHLVVMTRVGIGYEEEAAAIGKV